MSHRIPNICVWQTTCKCLYVSERADTDMYRLLAPIWAICRYIGFTDKEIAYRYRLLVSADKPLHIGF